MERIPEKAIWIRFPRFIGDSVMIHRAIEPLWNMGFPLVAWGPAHVVALFQGVPIYAGTVTDPPVKMGAWEMAKLLRTHKPRATISLVRSQRASLAAWLARVPQRVGWREGLGSLFCTDSLTFKTLVGHQQDRYTELLRKAFPGLPPISFKPFLPEDEAQAQADALLAALKPPFVVFSLGAMSSSKRLGRKVWIALAQQILDQGWSITLLGSTPDDLACADSIISAIGPVCNLTGKTSLAVAAGVIRRSSGLIGNDSALSHLAAACGMPTVVAFGPTDASMTAPVGDWVRVVRCEGLACLGCQEGACPIPGHPCMEDIRPELLLAALQEAMLRAF